MKKALILLLSLGMVLCFIGCGSSDDTEEATATDTYEVAMVTDIGTIDDKSFNQGTWEGVEEFAMDNDLTYKYYQPTEDSTDARMEQIDLAVENGAKVIATPGFLFEDTIFLAQDKYPEVKFILIDGNPHNADYTEYKTGDNAVGVTFAEQEAGYLAGYAAVKEGYTKLGFMGGMAVPAVVRYGYGFVQGANDAAAEMDVEVDMKYHYTGGFSASPDIQTKAAGWYAAGTEVIFSCGGGIFSSISAAAESSEAYVIGVDVDQSSQSDTVITSSMKGLKEAVVKALEAYKNDEFPGGEAWVLGAKDDAVGLPMETSLFETFTQEDYDAIFAKLVAGEIEISVDTDVDSASDIDAGNVIVDLVE
ncbi:MAG: BMP family ABC transporter substrate-binding protein [Peptostreptococcaceae bacterium]|nr:BMP family ABC transporter substrate-binding protein [Peptostreptococcaceae bacterium]